MEKFELTAEWQDTLACFRSEAKPFLVKLIELSNIVWIDADDLMGITEEKIGDFLSRDPINGWWFPESWAAEVFENFLSSETFYFDKLKRCKHEKRSV